MEAQKALSDKRAYRHTVAVEMHALQAVLEVGGVLLADPKAAAEQKVSADLLEQIRELKAVEAGGMIEPYIFFVRADTDIAQEYGAYRVAHRDKLLSYLRQNYLHQSR